jgi:hypothetical protein
VSYKVEQCHIRAGGREFHFVSYEEQPANDRRGVPAVPAMWYLMGPAKRWPVMPQISGQSQEDIEAGLLSWVIGQGLERQPNAPRRRTPATRS